MNIISPTGTNILQYSHTQKLHRKKKHTMEAYYMFYEAIMEATHKYLKRNHPGNDIIPEATKK